MSKKRKKYKKIEEIQTKIQKNGRKSKAGKNPKTQVNAKNKNTKKFTK